MSFIDSFSSFKFYDIIGVIRSINAFIIELLFLSY